MAKPVLSKSTTTGSNPVSPAMLSGVTVAQWTLNPLIEVRILSQQPKLGY